MKRLVSLGAAFILLIFTFVGYNSYLDRQIENRKNAIDYVYFKEKADGIAALNKPINANNLLVFGSSELSNIGEKTFPDETFHHGNSDFNLTLVGTASQQSLWHAVQLGALSGKIQNKKVALILSAQWFTKSHLEPQAFASRFNPVMFEQFIQNKDISVETRKKIVDRCEQLLVTDRDDLNEVQNYRSVYLDNKSYASTVLSIKATQWFKVFKAKYNFVKATSAENYTNESYVKAEDINFNQLKEFAEQQGKKDCTNNSLYIYDDYYTTYVEPALDKEKGSDKNSSYCDSAEYDDLRLFLEVCRELKIQPMLVIIPVHGLWYDYTGFPKADRDQYYQNVRDIAGEYGASVADFSSEEYTPYFLRDIMHLGWKGWVEVEQSLYEFYKQD